MGVPLPIDNIDYARRLYYWTQECGALKFKWSAVKAAMEKEFPKYDFSPSTYSSQYYRLEMRYGLKPITAYFSYIQPRPIEELLGDTPEPTPVILTEQTSNYFPPSPPTPAPSKTLGTIDEEVAKRVDTIHTKQTMREYTKALEDRGRTEIICTAIREGVKALPLMASPPPYLPAPPGTREYEALLMLSDMQIGQYTRADETGGLVEYSTEIFYERMANLESQLVRRISEMRRAYIIRKLFIAGLGDFVENETIFKGQKSQIDSPVMDQFLNASAAISEFIYRLLALFEDIEFVGVPGNHGRIGDKGEANLFTNWDILLYEFIKARLGAQPRISIEVPRSWWIIKQIRNSRFLLTHGDNIKAWNAIPYYGFDRADARQTMLMQSKGLQYDYWLTAHHHNSAAIDRPFGERIINGAFPGGSVFSAHQLNTASQPAQTLLFVGDTRVEWQEKLRVAEVE